MTKADISHLVFVHELWKERGGAPNNLFLNRLRFVGLSEEHVTKVVECLDNICLCCFDADPGCQCWNDE